MPEEKFRIICRAEKVVYECAHACVNKAEVWAVLYIHGSFTV